MPGQFTGLERAQQGRHPVRDPVSLWIGSGREYAIGARFLDVHNDVCSYSGLSRSLLGFGDDRRASQITGGQLAKQHLGSTDDLLQRSRSLVQACHLIAGRPHDVICNLAGLLDHVQGISPCLKAGVPALLPGARSKPLGVGERSATNLVCVMFGLSHDRSGRVLRSPCRGSLDGRLAFRQAGFEGRDLVGQPGDEGSHFLRVPAAIDQREIVPARWLLWKCHETPFTVADAGPSPLR